MRGESDVGTGEQGGRGSAGTIVTVLMVFKKIRSRESVSEITHSLPTPYCLSRELYVSHYIVMS